MGCGQSFLQCKREPEVAIISNPQLLAAAQFGDVPALEKILSALPDDLVQLSALATELAHVTAQNGQLTALHVLFTFVTNRHIRAASAKTSAITAAPQPPAASSSSVTAAARQTAAGGCTFPPINGRHAAPPPSLPTHRRLAALSVPSDVNLRASGPVSEMSTARFQMSCRALSQVVAASGSSVSRIVAISGSSILRGSRGSILAKPSLDPAVLAAIKQTVGRMLDRPNRRGQTPLMLASWYGHAPVVDFLLQQGADPQTTSKTGRGPLHAAALGGRDECVHALLQHVRRDAARLKNLVDYRTPSGFTPLMYAVASGNLAAVTALLRCGPDVLVATTHCRAADVPFDMADCKKVTALHLAAQGGHEAIVEEILRFYFESGSSVPSDPRRALNSQDMTPQEVAEAAGHKALGVALRPRVYLDRFACAATRYATVPILKVLAARATRQMLAKGLRAVEVQSSNAASQISLIGSVSQRDIEGLSLHDATRPASAAASGGISKRRPWTSENGAGAAATCGVCMDEVDMLQLLPCRHSLCHGCAARVAQQLVLQPVRCPFCRQPIAGFDHD